jgi:hypothetical protein
MFASPKLAEHWVGEFFARRTLNTVWLVHLFTDSILEISPRLPSLETCRQQILRGTD